MKITIPTENGEIKARLDMSLLAEERWEQHFPKMAEKETVFSYIARLQNLKLTADTIAPHLLTVVKALYCFIESDDLPEFRDFARLFAMTNADLLNRQVQAIQNALQAVLEGSIASPKN